MRVQTGAICMGTSMASATTRTRVVRRGGNDDGFWPWRDRRAGEKSEEAVRLSGMNFFAEKMALASCDSRNNLNFYFNPNIGQNPLINGIKHIIMVAPDRIPIGIWP